MNIDKIIESLPEKSADERARMRDNADRLLTSGTAQQQAAAQKLKDAITAQETLEQTALYERLKDQPVATRVIEAFRTLPPTETDLKVLKALLDNPGSTSTALSQALGWGGQSWHMHFGKMCFEREAYLWPAEKFEKRDKSFYSGILADFDRDGAFFTMKLDVVKALAELGIHGKTKA